MFPTWKICRPGGGGKANIEMEQGVESVQQGVESVLATKAKMARSECHAARVCGTLSKH